MAEAHDTEWAFSPQQCEEVAIVTGRVHPQLASGVAEFLGTKLDPIEIKDFPNGEVGVRYERSVRGRDVYILQTHFQSLEQDLHRGIFEHSLMIDAAKRAGARSVIAVAPHIGYGRQDRKADGRVPISAAMMIKRQLGAANAIVAVDLHSQQAQGFTDEERPLVTLTAFNALADAVNSEIGELHNDDWVVVAPDAGGAKLADDWSDELRLDFLGLSKVRSRGDSSTFTDGKIVVPDLTDHNVLIVDDMIDTGETMARSVQKIIAAGAGSVLLAATHGLFSKDAFRVLIDSGIDRIITTNTVPVVRAEQALGNQLRIVDIAPVIGAGIFQMVNGRSVSELSGSRNHR